MADGAKRDTTPANDLPRDLSQPARRALAAAGYDRLAQFTTVTAAEIGRLHGVGPKSIRQIARDLALRGQSFAGGET